ncbi:unnamed protein product [Adineta ricciae]|uniref:Uncharacterized protein n=1 Tax=Adineta ricciae TaxID=249248 RepID=A0A813RVJ8_ADIRI|nr:unnamed protein product [Adineta ricciae]
MATIFSSNITDTTIFSPSQVGFVWNFIVDRINKNESNTTNDFDIRHNNQYGGSGILSLGLYLHSYQYLPYTTNVVGAVILVHDNNQLPSIESSGVELGPRRRELIFYLHRIQTCSCINPFLWNVRIIVLPGTNKTIVAPLCAANNPCAYQTFSSLIEDSSLLMDYCSECSQDCSLINFPTQLSSSQAFVENSSVRLPANWSTLSYDYIQQNYLTINIVTETNIVETNAQTAAMGIVDVISNIGGQT